jgi:DNA-directed RNA polymerase subunit RPC12/RpoP
VEKNFNNKSAYDVVPDHCPHCGIKLSPWQQVLLRVDRALTCKNCWYRIIISIQPDNSEETGSESQEKE